MTKSSEEKIDNVLLVSIINIILLVLMFFLYDIFYIILGHSEYFLVNARSLLIGDYAILMRLNKIIETYVLIGVFLATIYSIYCVHRSSKFKKHGKKHRYLYRMNILILIYYILSLFIALLNPVPFNGLIG